MFVLHYDKLYLYSLFDLYLHSLEAMINLEICENLEKIILKGNIGKKKRFPISIIFSLSFN